MRQHRHRIYQNKRTTHLRKQTSTDTNGENKMTFDEWIKLGYDEGFCSPPVCSTHDGVPTTATEDEEWEDGEDPCMHIVRLYSGLEEKKSVEANHSPTEWRAANLGWAQ